MSQRRATLALIAALALLVTAAPGTSAAPKPKPPPEPAGALVALGDSFSAGTGTFAGVNECYQSVYAYPVLLAQRTGAPLDFRACEGATTADVSSTQLSAPLPSNTARVTMTIGGNDVGFADVLTECALPGWLSDCDGAIQAGRTILTTELGDRLDGLYGAIKTAAPASATISVAGYPHLFNEVSDCSLITYFDRGEMAKLNDATDELDTLIAQRTTAAQIGYLDPRAAFDNHQVCDSSPYVNGYSSPVGESYHPNRTGNVAYADLFSGGSGGGGGKGGGKPRAATTMSVDEQATYVARLGLDSSESLARAEAAGLDSREIRGLVGALRSGNETAQLAALKRLEVLDERAASPRG
ncbi:MAG: SGNH/GDSL hydrolase family protein [Dermatophilaceae bacterium]